MADERDAQKAYWQEHSTEPTVEAMMLDSKAADIDRLERPEVTITTPLAPIPPCSPPPPPLLTIHSPPHTRRSCDY